MQNNQSGPGQLAPRLHQGSTPIQYGSLPVGLAPSDVVVKSIRLRRAGSEWSCDNAKNFLRKVESRKLRRRKVQVQENDGLVITRTQEADTDNVKQCILLMDINDDGPIPFDISQYPESPLGPDATTSPNYCFDVTKTGNGDTVDELSQKWQQLRINSRTQPLASLSCGQLHMLRKLATIKLKGILQEYCSTHRTRLNWEFGKLKRRIKASDYKDKNIFGVPLTIVQQKTGKVLPPGIIIAINWLRKNALEQVGLFRKSGVKSRIKKLKMMIENLNEMDLQDQQAYDVADMIKQYFRELPEVLLTNKLSEILILIFQYVPMELRKEAVKWVLLLLPNENSEVLQILLDFLYDVSLLSHVNQMTPSNLALCLVPTLFYFRNTGGNTGTPSQQELEDNQAAHQCLLFLICHNSELFEITDDLVAQCHFNYLEYANPVTLSHLGSNLGRNQGWREYQESCIAALLKAARERSLSWINIYNPYRPHIDISYQKVGDKLALELWRVCAEVEAPPSEVLHRILYERLRWDETCIYENVIKQLHPDSHVYHYVLSYEGIKPLYNRDFCVLRTWETELQKCMIVETSIEYPDAPVMSGAVRALVLASRYLIEPCGSGKSRIFYLVRMDIKGKTLEWYKYFGHLCAIHIDRICKSFARESTIGPESKV